jgi:hypothetical protein
MMNRNSLVLGILLGVLLAAAGARAANTEARLILSHEAARAGDTITAGIQLKMNPGWHTYWRNGAIRARRRRSSGAAQGRHPGEINGAAGENGGRGPVTSLYHGDVMLLVPRCWPGICRQALWNESEGFVAERKTVSSGSGTVAATLKIGDPSHLRMSRSLRPEKEGAGNEPGVDVGALGGKRRQRASLRIEWKTGPETGKRFFRTDEKFNVKPATEKSKIEGGLARVRSQVEKIDAWPDQIAGCWWNTATPKTPRGVCRKMSCSGVIRRFASRAGGTTWWHEQIRNRLSPCSSRLFWAGSY